jgi:hypothetical protein
MSPVITPSEAARVSEPQGTPYNKTVMAVRYKIHESAPTFSVELTASHSPLVKTIGSIIDLLTWPEGWNGNDVAAPNPNTVGRALPWIKNMYEDALAVEEEWHVPHVTADEDGDVMFEWWNNGKGLTIYVSEESASYLTAWGTNMIDQMEDGKATDSETRRRLWEWLLK